MTIISKYEEIDFIAGKAALKIRWKKEKTNIIIRLNLELHFLIATWRDYLLKFAIRNTNSFYEQVMGHLKE